jgi:hypothetical protein
VADPDDLLRVVIILESIIGEDKLRAEHLGSWLWLFSHRTPDPLAVLQYRSHAGTQSQSRAAEAPSQQLVDRRHQAQNDVRSASKEKKTEGQAAAEAEPGAVDCVPSEEESAISPLVGMPARKVQMGLRPRRLLHPAHQHDEVWNAKTDDDKIRDVVQRWLSRSAVHGDNNHWQEGLRWDSAREPLEFIFMGLLA